MQAQTQQIQDSIHQVEGVMISLMQRLSQLAPHPDAQSKNGMALASINSDITPAADYDGMMGSLGLEAGLGGVFAAAADAGAAQGAETSSPLQALDSQTILDAADEYLKERCVDTNNNQGRGRGSIALGEHKTICNTFNTLDERQVQMNAFYQDHEERILIEKHLIACDRKLSLLKRQQQPVAAFTPPTPSYAPQFGLAA